MKLIKMFVLIIVLLAVVFFLTLNSKTAMVDLLYAKYDTFVYVIILVSLGIGLIIGFLMATGSVLSAKNTARALRSKNKKLIEELNLLRNVHVEDDLTTSDAIKEA